MVKEIPQDVRRICGVHSVTDICPDYFNDIIGVCVNGDIATLENPEIYPGGKDRIYRLTKEQFERFPRTYTEYIKKEVSIANMLGEPFSVDDLVSERNCSTITKLDEIATQMKKLRSTLPESIDIEKLRVLMYEAAVLIYGEEKRGTAKKRFNIK